MLHTRGYETALKPEQWEYLCRFLKMNLTDVLALTGPELWQATQRQIQINQRRARVLPSATLKLADS